MLRSLHPRSHAVPAPRTAETAQTEPPDQAIITTQPNSLSHEAGRPFRVGPTTCTYEVRRTCLQISGKQIDIGEALQTHVQDSLGTVVEKFSMRPTDATVIFSKSGAEYVCEATIHLSTGLTASAKGHAHEIYAAFETSAEKMEKQLRRYKRRLKDHHRDRQDPVETFGAAMYVLAPAGNDVEENEPADLQPIIVAEMETKIPSLSVGEAVMQMELAGAPVLVFRNEGHNGVNVVYRRDDGNVGWIDPPAK